MQKLNHAELKNVRSARASYVFRAELASKRSSLTIDEGVVVRDLKANHLKAAEHDLNAFAIDETIFIIHEMRKI